jgi:hypothetical protein
MSKLIDLLRAAHPGYKHVTLLSQQHYPGAADPHLHVTVSRQISLHVDTSCYGHCVAGLCGAGGVGAAPDNKGACMTKRNLRSSQFGVCGGRSPNFRGTSNRAQLLNHPNSQLPADVDGSVVMLTLSLFLAYICCDGDHNDSPRCGLGLNRATCAARATPDLYTTRGPQPPAGTPPEAIPPVVCNLVVQQQPNAPRRNKTCGCRRKVMVLMAGASDHNRLCVPHVAVEDQRDNGTDIVRKGSPHATRTSRSATL